MTAEQDTALAAYDYHLPADRIAQVPAVPRDSSRLLVVAQDHHIHSTFRDLPLHLKPGDLLVLNNTRVLPARLLGRKVAAGGQKGTPVAVELFLLEPQPEGRWLALVKPGRRLKPGAVVEFGPVEQPSLYAKILETDPETRGRIVAFSWPSTDSFEVLLQQVGQVPLPPYIEENTEGNQALTEQYQTVYAEAAGAVAAPTAGLHFTPELLSRLAHHNIRQAYVTLHVGIGTFRPVEAECITEHQMHGEWVELPPETAQAIQETQAQGGRIIAVGTTVVRTLEGVYNQTGSLSPYQGKVNLFIYPGYSWRVVEGLITNFHLPKSSLLMLVSALTGRERLMQLYQMAIAHQYRFYSFGDAMLILPEAVGQG